MNYNERKQERIEHLRPRSEECGSVCDLSEGGVALFLDRKTTQGQISKIQIQIGDLNLHAKISAAHCTSSGDLYRAGFQFVDLTPDNKSVLREMVSRYSRGVPVKLSFC